MALARVVTFEDVTARPPRAWRQGRLLGLALAITATLAACGGDSSDEGAGRSTIAPAAGSTLTTPSEGNRQPILIKTQIEEFAGKVLAGSVVGDSPFCPGGTLQHERGSPDIGWPAVNVFSCPDGELRIGFGPGADQMNNVVQTSAWKILDGSGRFAGISGDGQMTVRWEAVGSPNGQETFTGQVVVP